MAGRTGIDELNESLDWELPEGDYETVAGLVLATLHRLPLVGEVFHVGRYTLTVLEADPGAFSPSASPRPARLRAPTVPADQGPYTSRRSPRRENGHGRTKGAVSDQWRTRPRLSRAPAAGKGPGVLVIQEWWGLVTHQDVCDRFAAEGFAALAPDLYHGKTANQPDAAGKLFMALNIARPRRTSRGAAQVSRRTFLDAQDRRGGLLHGRAARALRRLHRSEHRSGGGLLRHPSECDARLHDAVGPVLGLFAEHDAFVTPETARESKPDQEGGQTRRDSRVSGGRPRLLNDANAAAYDKAAAADAWRRTLAHFRANLK